MVNYPCWQLGNHYSGYFGLPGQSASFFVGIDTTIHPVGLPSARATGERPATEMLAQKSPRRRTTGALGGGAGRGLRD